LIKNGGKDMNPVILLIPIYQPDEQTVLFIQNLRKMIFGPIVIVDDGSGAKYRSLFLTMQEPDVSLLSYEKNQGKGHALKLGFQFIKKHFSQAIGVVTADGDGQHTLADIMEMSRRLEEVKAQTILLGIRFFYLKSTPLRSFIGNRVTTFFYYLSSGIWLTDTQTGLRGFPYESIDDLLDISGERFEYEMNQLIELPNRGYSFEKMPITTVYEKNHQYHFRTIQDSYLVYKPLIAFLLSSFSSAGVDVLLFFLMVLLLGWTTSGLLL